MSEGAGRYGANYRTAIIRRARRAESAFLLFCHTCNIETYHGFVINTGKVACIKCGTLAKAECKCINCWKLYKDRNYSGK